MTTTAIVTAGGTGTRMLNSIPKQFLTINETPIIIYTLKKLQESDEIDRILIACLDEWKPAMGAYVKEYRIDKVVKIVSGGKTGIESIKNAFESIDSYERDDIILVHDGNRPLVDKEIISNNIDAAKKYGATSTYTDIHDGIVKVDGDMEIMNGGLSRDQVKTTQTPHAFTFDVIIGMFKKINRFEEYISLADAAVKLDYRVKLVKGSEINFKITTKNDLDIFGSIIAKRKSNV